MIPDNKPILFTTPEEFDEIEVYLCHDIHYGSELHDRKAWDRLKAEILDKPNRYVIWLGDYIEAAIIGSKSDSYTQNHTLEAQRIWMEQQFADLKNQTLAIISGNHERRISRAVGLYPVYDAAVCAGVGDKFRNHYAFLDVAVGSGGHGAGKQNHYVGYLVHHIQDLKNFNGADAIDGIDFCAFGHTHRPMARAMGKLVYDSKNKTIKQKSVPVINAGSVTLFGGYGADAGCRPLGRGVFKLILSGKSDKRIAVNGVFY